ncbi:DUF6093 family protein [Pseudoclavibacter alba]|uniref:DUF6093 family protein n=1 Tax=Pseudoclavibacter albus TaxID=272241 RepID=A0ABT2HWC6_9MICO|nr:DUF6093 family protein [Pseudoclavibacter alba]MCT2042611.1 DUF6093 family protein [Pseudoclavibacter alba]
MSLIDRALAMGRNAALMRMRDTCTIGPVAAGELDEATGQVTKSISSVYAGPCELAETRVMSQYEDGTRDVVTGRTELRIPWSSAAPIFAGHYVEVDGVEGVFRVVREQKATNVTARRFDLETADWPV